MRVKFALICLMIWMTVGQAFAVTKPLPADQAFALSVSMDNANKVNVHWQIAKDYYLYRQKIHFDFEPKVAADFQLPPGQLKKDEHEVYTGDVNIPVALNTQMKTVQFKVDYQGCSDKGFCYPPMQQVMTLNLAANSVMPVNSLSSLLTDQNSVRDLLGSQSLGVMLLIFGGLGLLLAFTPCILPMIPILTSIIVGHKQPVSTKKASLLSSTYVLGSALTYAAAGMIAASMGGSLQVWLQQPWIIALVGGLFILLSLSLFGVYDLRLPGKLQNRITAISRKQQGGTYAGAFVMGMVSTLIVSPCVTAPLVGVLMYIADSGNMALGAGALFAMGIGMGIPLILIGTSAGKWLPKRGRWMILVQKAFGVLMLGMALWMFSRVYAVANPYSDVQTNSSFTLVHNMQDLNHQLMIAQASGKPVILDFYADWCESCVDMDKNVFSMQDVLHGLNKFVLLRADLSRNTAADEDLLRNFDVIAPPTVLFFNNQGQEVNSHRIVGELNAKDFMTRINTFITASCDKKMTC